MYLNNTAVVGKFLLPDTLRLSMMSVTKLKTCVQWDHPSLQKLAWQFWNYRTNYLRLGLFMQVQQVSRYFIYLK